MEWHQAVALVQQLLDEVAPDRTDAPAGTIPPLASIRLDSSSRLQVQLGPGDEPFVAGLARVLTELLQANPAPAPLRLLGIARGCAIHRPTLEEFARELAGWERPGRVASLSAFARRASRQRMCRSPVACRNGNCAARANAVAVARREMVPQPAQVSLLEQLKRRKRRSLVVGCRRLPPYRRRNRRGVFDDSHGGYAV